MRAGERILARAVVLARARAVVLARARAVVLARSVDETAGPPVRGLPRAAGLAAPLRHPRR